MRDYRRNSTWKARTQDTTPFDFSKVRCTAPRAALTVPMLLLRALCCHQPQAGPLWLCNTGHTGQLVMLAGSAHSAAYAAMIHKKSLFNITGGSAEQTQLPSQRGGGGGRGLGNVRGACMGTYMPWNGTHPPTTDSAPTPTPTPCACVHLSVHLCDQACLCTECVCRVAFVWPQMFADAPLTPKDLKEIPIPAMMPTRGY